MNNNGFPNGDPPHGHGPSGTGEILRMPEILRHLTLALAAHVHRLHQKAVPVPREVEELTVFLMRIARIRQDSPIPGGDPGTAHHADSPDRLLVTKGEAAERLGVSVRTIERLVASGRLPQVHVERLARFRVSDLEAYVNSLTESHTSDTDTGNHDGRQ